jgi:uncharacterized protein YecT (DUF1311 family)
MFNHTAYRSGLLLLLVSINCTAEEKIGPSFDCQRATLEIEKWICNDPQLALADQIIHDSYRLLLKQVANRQALIAEQRAWLKARNNFRDEQKNKIFFEGKVFEQGGFYESEQVNNAFANRLYELFHRLPKAQQQPLREGYLRRMGYRHTPTDPVEKMLYLEERDYAWENITDECYQMANKIIRNDHGIAVLARQSDYLCDGRSVVSTGITAYCVTNQTITAVDTTQLQSAIGLDGDQLSVEDERIVEFANRLSAKTLCQTAK